MEPSRPVIPRSRTRSPPRLSLDLPISTSSFKRTFEELGFGLETLPDSPREMAAGTAAGSDDDGSSSPSSSTSSSPRSRAKRARSEESDQPSAGSPSGSNSASGHGASTNRSSISLSPIEGVSPISNSLPWRRSSSPSPQMEAIRSPLNDNTSDDEDEDELMEDAPSEAHLLQVQAPSLTSAAPRSSSLSSVLRPFEEPASPSPPESMPVGPSSSRIRGRPLPPTPTPIDSSLAHGRSPLSLPLPSVGLSEAHTAGLPEQDFFGPGSLGSTTPPWLRSGDTIPPRLPMPNLGSTTGFGFDSTDTLVGPSTDSNAITAVPPPRPLENLGVRRQQLPPLIPSTPLTLDSPAPSPPPRLYVPSSSSSALNHALPQLTTRSDRTLFPRHSQSFYSIRRRPSSALASPLERTSNSNLRVESPLFPMPPAPRAGTSYRYDDGTGEWVDRTTPSSTPSSTTRFNGTFAHRPRLGEFLELAPSPSPSTQHNWALRAGFVSPSVDGTPTAMGPGTPQEEWFDSSWGQLERLGSSNIPSLGLGRNQMNSNLPSPIESGLRRRRSGSASPLENEARPILPPVQVTPGLYDPWFPNRVENAEHSRSVLFPTPQLHPSEPGPSSPIRPMAFPTPSISTPSRIDTTVGGHVPPQPHSSWLEWAHPRTLRFSHSDESITNNNHTDEEVLSHFEHHRQRSRRISAHRRFHLNPSPLGLPSVDRSIVQRERDEERDAARVRPSTSRVMDVDTSVDSPVPSSSTSTNSSWRRRTLHRASVVEPSATPDGLSSPEIRRRTLDLDLSGFNASFEELAGYLSSGNENEENEAALAEHDREHDRQLEREMVMTDITDSDDETSSTRANTSIRRPRTDEINDDPSQPRLPNISPIPPITFTDTSTPSETDVDTPVPGFGRPLPDLVLEPSFSAEDFTPPVVEPERERERMTGTERLNRANAMASDIRGGRQWDSMRRGMAEVSSSSSFGERERPRLPPLTFGSANNRLRLDLFGPAHERHPSSFEGNRSASSLSFSSTRNHDRSASISSSSNSRLPTLDSILNRGSTPEASGSASSSLSSIMQRERNRLHEVIYRHTRRAEEARGVDIDTSPPRATRWGDLRNDPAASPPLRARSAWREEPRRLGFSPRHPRATRAAQAQLEELARSFPRVQEMFAQWQQPGSDDELAVPWRMRGVIGDYMSDMEFDDSYDSLLRLGQILGEAKPRTTPPEVIESLPTAKYKDWKSDDTETRCPICLDDYTPEDPVQKLPDCNHWFHKDCLGQWLKTAYSCPVCRQRIKRTRGSPAARAANGSLAGPSRTTRGTMENWIFGPASPRAALP